MSSVTSPLASTSADSSSSTASASSSTTSSTASTFSGTSQYAKDLQNAITRAVAIASMPITQLKSRQSFLEEQKAAYTSLQTKVESLQNATEALAAALGSSSYAAGNSNSNAATATVFAGAQVGTYTVTVTDPGTFTKALSDDGLTTVADPSSTNIASGTSFTLSVDGHDTTITLTKSSLSAMAAAINNANAGVAATVINLGTPSAADYRLSLQSTATKNVAIDLTTTGGTSLVTVGTGGSEGSYQVNGAPAAGIASTSPTVTIAPGVTATLQGAGTTVITVSRDTSALSAALSTLASAYNSAATELSQYHGKNGGVLQGQSEIWSTQSNLRNLINFIPTGSATSLIQLGFTFNLNGQLSFDSSKLSSASMSNLDSFFGDGTTAGFIKNADSVLSSIDDSVSGTLASSMDSISKQIESTTNEIDSEQQRVDTLQESLTARMAAADATIAMLQSQADYFTSLFEAMKIDSQNINNG
jgi:flagellar hook-associated protein 2